MKAISCNQGNGGHRKGLFPGAPQGPTRIKINTLHAPYTVPVTVLKYK